MEAYPHFFHKTDKLGRSIYIEQLGLLDLKKLLAVTTEERMLKHFIQNYEFLLRWIYPACSEEAGCYIETGLTIIDLRGFELKRVNKKVYELV
mmetsp:Transcript_11844/g.8631  ORF Transcript_11844/g.8631 Transcript_11844/m.8631 type:complete len:93 (+) Transcript_11844:261-539(+)